VFSGLKELSFILVQISCCTVFFPKEDGPTLFCLWGF
jgi:hypothetical protein